MYQRRLLIFLLLSFSISCWSQSVQERIIEKEHLIKVSIWNNKDGLPTWLITDMSQDQAGNIWLGTKNGFCRFDGHSFEEYKVLQPQAIREAPFFVAPDANGNIWVLGNDQYSIIDPIIRKQYSFEAYTGVAFPFQGQHVSTYRTRTGIYFFNKKEGWRYNEKLEKVIGLAEPLGRLLPAPQEHFWAFDPSSGIRLLDKTGKEQALFPVPAGTLPSSYWLDEDLHLWLADLRGASPKMYRVSPQGVERVSHDQIDNWGNQFRKFHPSIHIPGNGYAFFPNQDQQYQLFYRNQVIISDFNQWLQDHFKMSISQYNIFTLDDPGVIWISGVGGLIRLELTPLLAKWSLNQKNQAVSIREIAQISPDQLGVCTYNGFFLQKANGKTIKTSIPNQPTPKAILPATDCFWIGAFEKEIYQYFPQRDTYRQLQNVDSVFMKEANCFLRLPSAGLTLGSDNGLWRIDSLNGSFQRFAMPDTAVYCFHKSNNQTWLGTKYGLYDWNSRTLHPFSAPEGQNELPVAIYHLSEDATGRFWMATNQGLMQWESSDSSFRSFSPQQGLPTGRYHSVYPDRAGTLWISANNGLARFDPQSGQSLTLKSLQGVQYQEFNFLAHHQDSEGRLYYGGLNGIISFHPDSLPPSQQKQVYPIQLRKVLQKSWLNANDVSEKIYRESPSSIRIPAHIQQVNLDFSFPYYDQAPAIFQWRMAGYADEWQYFNDHHLILQRLPYGKQKLEIRVSPNDAPGKILARSEIVLQVAYPVFLRWWFLLVVGLLLSALIRLIVIWRGRQLRKQNRRLQELIAEKTEKIQRQSQRLEAMLSVKNQLFTDISHEFRTPLSLIIGHTELLKQSGSNQKERKKSLKEIQANSQYIREMVEDILNLSRLQSQELQLQPSLCEWPTLFTQIINNSQTKASSKQIDFQYQLSPPEKELIFLDQKKVQRVINNLVGNALKFTPSQGSVKMDIQKDQHSITVRIQDSGPGIPAHELPHIFDRYYKGNQPSNSGFGIGLALSKAYAELMQGRLSVESTSTKGSTFLFRFPLAAAPSTFEGSLITQPILSRLPDTSPNTGTHNTALPHLLLVEDMPNMLHLLQQLLNKDYRLSTARNGQQALQALEKDASIELVVSDIMMPLMDGFELLEQVRNKQRLQHLPFLLLTAMTEDTARKKAFTLGVDSFLPKPFEAEELRYRIAAMIKNIRLRQHSPDLPKVNADQKVSQSAVESYDYLWLKELEELIDERLEQPNLKIGDLALAMNVSERTFRNRVKAYTGLSPAQYVKKIRLQKALIYMQNRKYSTISEVCFAIGMQNVSHFAKIFKEEFGVLPSDYLSRQHE